LLLAAIAFIAVGVLITGCALVPWSSDFAVAVAPRWHVVVFPPPVWVGLVAILAGSVALLWSVQWR
jgi:hypothetical protein